MLEEEIEMLKAELEYMKTNIDAVVANLVRAEREQRDEAEDEDDQQPPCDICGHIDGDSSIFTYACNGSCGRQICEECSVEEEDRDEDSIICVECEARATAPALYTYSSEITNVDMDWHSVPMRLRIYVCQPRQPHPHLRTINRSFSQAIERLVRDVG